MSDTKGISAEVVAQHNNRESCWVVIHDKVYDVTDFLDEHPGGPQIILKYAGQDASDVYDDIHPPDAVTRYLPKEKQLGPVDVDTLVKKVRELTDEQKEIIRRKALRPSLDEMLNLHDFEAIAKLVLDEKAWAYYSSASDDEISLRENHAAYHRIWFRPRLLRDVSKIDFNTEILGFKSSMPIYISATALGRLADPDGELCFTRAAAKHGIIQMIPTLASFSFDDIVNAAAPGQVQFLQLYVNPNRKFTEEFVQHAEKRGVKALFLTIDAPQLGKREKDMRQSFEYAAPSEQIKEGGEVKRNQGAARAISGFIDPSVSWADLKWFRSITKMPIVLKGIQTWEDAVLAAKAGVQGIVLSNHGGRQLDFSPSGIEVLIDVIPKLKSELGMTFPNPNFQIFVDGGVRRATDVLKAIALGATAVGIGRPFLYALSAYGQEGVERALDILHGEFDMDMRLIGAPTLKDLNPSMVDTRSMGNHVVPVPRDHMFDTVYESMRAANLKEKAHL